MSRHAELKIQYAEELENNPEAWKNWQWKSFGDWADCKSHPNWIAGDYRRKPPEPKPKVDLSTKEEMLKRFPYVSTNHYGLEAYVNDIRLETWLACCQAHKDLESQND